MKPSKDATITRCAIEARKSTKQEDVTEESRQVENARAFAKPGTGSCSRVRSTMLLRHDIALAGGPGTPVRLEARLNAVGFYEGFGLGAVWRAVVRPNEIEMPVVIIESTRYSARLPFMMYPLTRILSTGSASTGAKGSRWAFRTRTMSETRTHSSASSV
jgi:hypothetical protein